MCFHTLRSILFTPRSLTLMAFSAGCVDFRTRDFPGSSFSSALSARRVVTFLSRANRVDARFNRSRLRRSSEFFRFSNVPRICILSAVKCARMYLAYLHNTQPGTFYSRFITINTNVNARAHMLHEVGPGSWPTLTTSTSHQWRIQAHANANLSTGMSHRADCRLSCRSCRVEFSVPFTTRPWYHNHCGKIPI